MNNKKFANRLVVLDTETTGLNPQEGHRIIEIGCVELINRRLTGNRFHAYINPNRIIDAGAIEVHGITNDFLEDKPHFKDIAEDFIAFITGSELVIHNAPFDVGFINHEFSRLTNTQDISAYSKVFDTLTYARKKHPGQRNSLDALCKRYGIDNSHRDLHGALLDAEILADVFLLMTGGQASLIEETQLKVESVVDAGYQINRLPVNRQALKVIRCNEDETNDHQHRLEAIEKASGGSIWNR